jgi:hypothetical protein
MRASTPHGTSRARVVVAIAWLVALVAVLVPSDERLAASAGPRALDAELTALERTAGLDGASDPLGVRVEVDGPDWLADAATGVVAEHDAFALGEGPHRLTASVGVDGPALVARWSLERRGWAIHAPHATTRRLLPVLAVAPLLLGLLIWWRGGRGVAVAVGVALVVQATATWWPWPASIPRPATRAAESALVAWIVDVAQAMDDHAVAIAAGVIALCGVLAWFDHRRSKSGTRIGGPLLVVVCALAWFEAAVRVGCGAWLGTAWGVVGAAAAIGGWVVAVRDAMRQGAP